MNQRTKDIFGKGIHPKGEKIKVKWVTPVVVVLILAVIATVLIITFSSDKETITGMETVDIPEEPPINLPIIQEKPPIEKETTAELGILKISISNITEGTYTEWDSETLLKVNKTYYKIYVKLFNPTPDQIDTVESIKIKDDLDNEYLPAMNPNKFIPVKELGKDWKIYPKISREGYLFFTEINTKAKNYDLIFEIHSDNEIKRATYSFQMIR